VCTRWVGVGVNYILILNLTQMWVYVDVHRYFVKGSYKLEGVVYFL